MQSTNYIVIQGWMCNELALKGNELLTFALIYGFSQDGVSKYYGGRKYIADTFNISLPTVDKVLQGLLDKEYIVKHISGDYINPDSYWVNLGVVKKLYEGSKETLSGGSKETLLNNTNSKNIDNKKNNSKELLQNPEFQFGKTRETKPNLFTKCVGLIDDFVSQYNCDSQIRNKLIEYLNYRLSVKPKPLYPNMWKGMLNKLHDLYEQGYEYTDIINFNLERGYLSFYPPRNYYDKSKPWEDGVTSNAYTDEELAELERLNQEREAKGMRTKF